jgi:excisionase family DNA binding protein
VAVRAKRGATREWVSLRDASDRLGISATTLRRWADAGTIRTFVTPGGHRRFSREAIDALLPGSGQRPSMERLGETPARMQRVYRRAVASSDTPIPWVGTLDPEQRALFRGHGVIMVTALLGALDAPDDEARQTHLVSAREAAAAYGSAAAEARVPASVAVEVFLRFRRPFLAELSELARRRGLDATAVTDLLQRATDAFDELLLATVRSLEARLAQRRRQQRAARVRVRPVVAAAPGDRTAAGR